MSGLDLPDLTPGTAGGHSRRPSRRPAKAPATPPAPAAARKPATPPPPPAPGGGGQQVTTASFPIGGVLLIGFAVLLIFQILGGDLPGRILSYWDYWSGKSPTGASSSPPAPANLLPNATAGNSGTQVIPPATAGNSGTKLLPPANPAPPQSA